MNIVDAGKGPPVVLIPGIQGRWEWMRPTVDALARVCRVITFSLADEPTSGARFDEALGFDNYVEQVREALDQCGVESATVCGISYAGLIAAAFAARYPDRTAGLVLVSALPPDWQPDPRVRFYLRAPRLLSPLFCLSSLRLYGEIATACGGAFAGVRIGARHAWTVLGHMFSPTRMARRVQLLEAANLERIARVSVPTLLITGEDRLDRVVPVQATGRYSQLWPHARAVVIANTGHLGSVTRPDIFAGAVNAFARELADGDVRRQVG